MTAWRMVVLAAVSMAMLFGGACDDKKSKTLALNWVPEPEFGGIYAAKEMGAFANRGLDVTIEPGGPNAPVLQRVASGQIEFGICSADELLIARSKGADVVAIFTIYQTCPQGIMAHRQRGLSSIEDAFKGGTLALELGLPYGKFLQRKYGTDKVNVVPYVGGIGSFMNDKELAQQCFVFSEPIAARRQGADPQVFLVADAGYNPYTGVVATRGQYARDNPQVIKDVVAALREGWEVYLKDPKPTNEVMAQFNKSMDAQTFAEAAKAQEPFVRVEGVPLGSMTLDRWETLGRQLVEIGVIDKAPPAEECMVKVE